MGKEEIKEKIISICAEVFRDTGVEPGMIEYVDFEDDLGMDSIAFVTLIVMLEECFEVTIPDDLMLIENFSNLQKITNIVFEQQSF